MPLYAKYMRFAGGRNCGRYVEIFSGPRSVAIAPGNNFCMFRLNERHAFFCVILLHTKVELSKIGLYYTRALEAKQKSGFSLN
jgi:hypothetical protein